MTQKRGVMYCNACPIAKECWELHRQRVKKIMPELAEHIDQLASQPNGQELIAKFVSENKVEPYVSVMMGNIEDGALTSHSKPVKDRGEYTLKYPFE